MKLSKEFNQLVRNIYSGAIAEYNLTDGNRRLTDIECQEFRDVIAKFFADKVSPQLLIEKPIDEIDAYADKHDTANQL